MCHERRLNARLFPYNRILQGVEEPHPVVGLRTIEEEYLVDTTADTAITDCGVECGSKAFARIEPPGFQHGFYTETQLHLTKNLLFRGKTGYIPLRGVKNGTCL